MTRRERTTPAIASANLAYVPHGTCVAPRSVMKVMTGLLAVGAAAITAYGVRRAQRRAAAKHQQEFNEIDFADLDEPVVVTEAEVVVTDAELVPPEDYH